MIVSAMLFVVAEIAAVAVSTVRPSRAQAAAAPAGEGFTVTAGDLHFIMKQIKIAEHHSATLTASNPCGTLVGSGPDQIPDRLTPYGLRTVDGSCNNLFPARERFGAADELFPRLATPSFRDADPVPPGFGPPGPSSYKQKTGNVFDDQPRVISNLIVDQTSENPAAVAASGHPVRSQDPTASSTPCTTDPDPTAVPPVAGVPVGCTPAHKTLFIPNVTTDVGLSPPYNSLFTFFGQFFDHGVDQTFKSGGTVFVPLRADDPLRTLGPDGKANTGDEVPDSQAFMVLTRAKDQPGPDGVLGTADDVQDATNTDSPWVDQSQTYTSHPSHQAFLREYVKSANGRDGIAGNADDGGPVTTGKLLGDPVRALGPDGVANTADDLADSGMAPWAAVKRQSRTLLGINLTDPDLLDMPMLATDPYGEFLPGPHGLPQLVTKGPDGKPNTADDKLVEGTLPTPVDVPTDVVRLDTPFVGDIAHNADPSPQPDPANPANTVTPKPDPDTIVNDPNKPLPAGFGFYDDELLDTHFAAGDGRANENIALTTIHQVFHSEHDRLIDDIKHTLSTDTSAEGAADLNAFWKPANPTPAGGPNVPVDANGWAGDRLFQAARFVTEMEYQHIVFEEFARKVQPAVRAFHVYNPDQNPAIPAEFAHAVYRFGHSMLDDDVARKTVDPNGTVHDNSLPLLTAFLNPPEFFNSSQTDPNAAKYTPEQAAGAVVMGSSDQVGNELDEFVTETLRNNLLGLPLDLPTINMARAREAGVPSLNQLRREIHSKTNDAQLAPYTDWSDFGQHLKHPESLINYVAAYGTHPTIRDSGPDGIKGNGDDVLTIKAKRDAARAIVDPLPTDVPPDDAADFMFSTGSWANKADGTTTTGLDNVDLWVGGLGEVTNLNGGLLGSTFNYVFQNTLENLQDFDRLYYLNRTQGLSLRTQLEGNSFAEMIERNTDGTRTLKADAFATADCKFELANLVSPAPAGSAITGAGSVADDPNTTDCDENALLLKKPDGTVQYRARNTVDPAGINGQSVYNGTAIVDRIFGGNDNDTLWGNEGNDILEGNGGDDNVLGGVGNDIITDLDGADVLEGGDGNDAIDAGPGNDLVIGGNGKDFTEGGANDNESFTGPGDDFVNAGQGADAVFGDGGDDWIQGGTGQDLLQGDHGAPFFDDPGETHPGNDVFIGQPGENDYDAEGGDDIMEQNPAIDRNAGAGGWDWAIHEFDTVPADDDLQINNQLAGLPLPVVVNRDRWQETEADSGGTANDVIRGDDNAPSGVGGAGFTGCDALDQAGLNRISGLAAIVPSLTTAGVNGVVTADSVAAISAAGTCPLSGNVWGDGNILLGGGGGDTIEGRGTNDIIDGDRALHVRISVRTNPADAATETGSTDLMEHPAVTGTFGAGTAGMTLSQAVFAGLVDPGNLVTVREIVTEPTTPGTIDTAVFSGPRSNYTITQAAGVLTVNQTGANVAGQKVSDGIDTLRNIENLRFSDGDVSVAPLGTLTAVTNGAFGSQQIGTTSATKTFTLANGGLNPLTFTAATRFSLTGTDAASFVLGPTTCTTSLAPGASCTVQVSFKPAAPAGAKSASLVATNNSGGTAGSTQSVALTGTATAAPAQAPATGTPVVAPLAPRIGQAITASIGTIADVNGVGALHFQWQATTATGTAFTNIAGATTASFTPPLARLCQSFRVQATFTDGLGHAEGPLTSAPTARATLAGGALCGALPPVVAAAAPAAAPQLTALGQALAPRPTPVPLAATTLSVSASRGAPLAVAATVPAGASTVAITVVRLDGLVKRTSAGRQRPTSVQVGTVFRKTTKAKRYVFRLTEKPFRHLKPGRYLVQVRVGSSRTALGPATSRQIRIRAARSTSAR
jgi:Ca2+-binding RTX toxin-like protein